MIHLVGIIALDAVGTIQICSQYMPPTWRGSQQKIVLAVLGDWDIANGETQEIVGVGKGALPLPTIKLRSFCFKLIACQPGFGTNNMAPID
jgi:hypothetical protein